MTKKENARYEAIDRGSIFLIDHNGALILLTLYATLKTRYNDLFLQISIARQKQYEQTHNITTDKGVVKDVMIDIVFKYLQRAAVQAYILNNTDVFTSLDKPITYLSHSSDNDAVGRAKDLTKIMSDNIGTLTELAPADILEMEDAIAAFVLILNKPTSQIKEKKAEGTDPIPGLLNEIDIIKAMIGKLISSYLPAIYSLWEAEIKVGKPIGTKHLSLTIKVTDNETNVPLRKVKATISNGTESIIRYSTKLGWIRGYSLESGNYTITVEQGTYHTIVLSNVGVDNLHITRKEVKLVKKTI